MADVQPFRGIRYDPAKVNIGDVITPPYDIISPEQRDAFYEKSPYSAIRLILNRDEPGDTWVEKYERSRRALEEWLSTGVLIQDEKPAFYVYEQEFTWDGKRHSRMGFVGRGRLYEYEEGVVVPHERTLSRAKEDRLNLLRATGTHFGLIFMLYNDESLTVDGVLKEFASSRGPDYEAVDVFGVTNRVWVLQDEPLIEEIRGVMADKKLYIADGHHRYETSLAYRNEMREKHGEGPWDYTMMMFVNMKNPGLFILPTHRWVYNLPYADIDIMLDECMEFFEVHPLDMDHDGAYAELVKRGKHNFLVYDARYHILHLRDDKKDEALEHVGGPERSRAWKELDVSILHSLLFERYLGITQENIQDHVKYTRDRHEAIKKVDDGTYEAAFLMNPPTMDEFLAVASAGDRMPQKSTYFYPKLVTGFVFYRVYEGPFDGNGERTGHA